MGKMMAFCGIACSECPAFIATQKDDNEERKKIAEQWSTEKYPLRPEDVNCDGCLTLGGKLMVFCEACDVRKCAFERNVENCAYCDDYPCKRLDKIFNMAPAARDNLEEVRKSR